MSHCGIERAQNNFPPAKQCFVSDICYKKQVVNRYTDIEPIMMEYVCVLGSTGLCHNNWWTRFVFHLIFNPCSFNYSTLLIRFYVIGVECSTRSIYYWFSKTLYFLFAIEFRHPTIFFFSCRIFYIVLYCVYMYVYVWCNDDCEHYFSRVKG